MENLNQDLKIEQDLILHKILKTIENELKVLDNCYDERVSSEIIRNLVIAYIRLKDSCEVDYD